MKGLFIITLVVAALTVLSACTPQEKSMVADAMSEDDTDDSMMTDADKAADDTNSMMDSNNDTVINNETMQDAESVLDDDGSTMMEETALMYTGTILAGTTTKYVDFTQEDYEAALADGKTVLLYFYANWCPTCQAEQPETHAAFAELELQNVVGFRVNYKDSDTDAHEEALAAEFGIAYQHTKVIIKNGERVLKSPESWDAERYISELTTYG